MPQLRPNPETTPLAKNVSIYIHLPICKSRCHYCDFTSLTPAELPIGQNHFADFCRIYVDRLVEELDEKLLALPELQNQPLQSVYFGGGTPSLFPCSDIARLLTAVCDRLQTAAEIEITIECNPESVTTANLATYRNMGITRVSLGIQTFHDDFLQRLGRIHTAKMAHEGLHAICEAGFHAASADLIFGIPTQTAADFELDLKTLHHYGVPHVSLYNLTLHHETPRLRNADLPSEAEQIEMYQLAHSTCLASGLHRYEISNFARQGFASVHNRAYWKRDHYLGLGIAAHSSIEYEGARIRQANSNNIKDYLDKRPLAETVAATEFITGPTYLFENIILGLRTTDGVPKNEWDTYLYQHLDRESLRRVKDLVKNDAHRKDALISEFFIRDGAGKNNPAVKLTDRGFLLSDSLFSELVPPLQAEIPPL